MLNGKPLIMKWFVPRPPVTPTTPTSEALPPPSAEEKEKPLNVHVHVNIPGPVTDEDVSDAVVCLYSILCLAEVLDRKHTHVHVHVGAKVPGSHTCIYMFNICTVV